MLGLAGRNIRRTARPIGRDRAGYHGFVDQIAMDVHAAFVLGAHQVILDLQGTTRSVSEYFDLAEALVEAGDLRGAA